MKKLVSVAVCVVFLAVVSFRPGSGSRSGSQGVAAYYDYQLDSLLMQVGQLQQLSAKHAPLPTIKKAFLKCRMQYKKSEFLVELCNPYVARLVNGPDLLKIDEENPNDSMRPNGLQTIETILYDPSADKTRLQEETALLSKAIRQLRHDPDRSYVFSDQRVWAAMRLGIFRIITLGISGFDVPLSTNALPETGVALAAIRQNLAFYKAAVGRPTWRIGDSLLSRAIVRVRLSRDFNSFDRLTYIKDYLNPISAWLATTAVKLNVVNRSERSPLNPDAKSLFDADALDIAFFSPNKDYRITPERIALGSRLFYDVRLSGNGSRSCASCHQPALAFTDGLPKPKDIFGKRELQRNTPTLWNTVYQTSQFYDSRTQTLENQLSAVVHNADEMNGSLAQALPWLKADTAYAAMFAQAYAATKEPISEYHLANAISSYVRSLVGLHSRFDRYMRGESADYTSSEKNGFNLFMGKAKCGTCHYAPIFNGLIPPLYEDTESETLAVPATNDAVSAIDPDPGRESFTHLPFHRYSFKTPTVRNAALTAPYMHNGVFPTLREVIRFYNDGGGAGRGISLATQTLPVQPLGLSENEMKDLEAFMVSLTDTVGKYK